MLLVCLKKYTTKRYLELEWILTNKYFIKIQNFVCYHAPHASDKTRFFEELLLTRLNKIIEDRKLITNFQFGFRCKHSAIDYRYIELPILWRKLSMKSRKVIRLIMSTKMLIVRVLNIRKKNCMVILMAPNCYPIK